MIDPFSQMKQEYDKITVSRFFFFPSGISVILILKYGITVSFSPAVGTFSSFWLTVFGERRSFSLLRYWSLRSPV